MNYKKKSGQRLTAMQNQMLKNILVNNSHVHLDEEKFDIEKKELLRLRLIEQVEGKYILTDKGLQAVTVGVVIQYPLQGDPNSVTKGTSKNFDLTFEYASEPYFNSLIKSFIKKGGVECLNSKTYNALFLEMISYISKIEAAPLNKIHKSVELLMVQKRNEFEPYKKFTVNRMRYNQVLEDLKASCDIDIFFESESPLVFSPPLYLSGLSVIQINKNRTLLTTENAEYQVDSVMSPADFVTLFDRLEADSFNEIINV